MIISGELDADESVLFAFLLLLLLLLLALLLFVYGGGGGSCLGCCCAALKAIVLAYDGGSNVGIVPVVPVVAFCVVPLVRRVELEFNTGGVVGGVLFCVFDVVVELPIISGGGVCC